MDEARYFRVKLEFERKVKVAKLEVGVDTSLSSFANLRKLIFKHFSEIRESVEASGTRGCMLLRVRFLDNAGDLVSVENDEDLEVARENLSKSDYLMFKTDMIPGKSNVAAPSFSTVGRVRSEGSRSLSGKALGKTYAAAATDNYVAKQEVCRAFERGHCRNGPTCRFLHESTRNSSILASPSWRRGDDRGKGIMMETHGQSKDIPLFRDIQEVDHWLLHQLSLPAVENIEQISGVKGLRALSQLVERRNLPTETITLLVKLLVKEEFRTSLLRQKTNKIYGALLGSPFLLQLHAHIASHVGNPTRAPKAEHVRPYLFLTEELQSRTADGWKEVPLDALHSMTLRLNESACKDDLLAIVSRLVDQREKLQRMLAVAPPDRCLQGAKFRQMSIVPGKEELFRIQARQDLPVNRIGMQYSRVSDYLETHFQLLREDCIEPLRQGIKVYCSNNDTKNLNKLSTEDLRIYTGVRLVAVRCRDQGVEHVLSFDISATKNDVRQWETSKKLMCGALLCISSNHFETFFWGVVASREVKELEKGLVAIRIIGESDGNVMAGLQSGQTSTEAHVMVESTTAYFEAYYHVMKSLQREEMEDIPFTTYLLRLDPRVSPPSYLLRRKSGDEYDFSTVFPGISKTVGRSTIRILQSQWPSGWEGSLDSAQQEALKQGLTKELAIIQGPPGTGKTFLGLLIVKILLANLRRSPGHDLNWPSRRRAELDHVLVDEETSNDVSGPILVICYTNHALDQFLEGIYRNGEVNLIRIGGRSKSDLLKENNLQTLLQKQRANQEVEGGHRRFFGQGRREKDVLESEIHKCIDAMGTILVSCSLLDGVATPEQMQSLFSVPLLQDEPSEKIVNLWLSEEHCVDPYLAQHFFVNENQRGDDEPVSFPKAGSEKPLRGQMKTLPKSEADQDGGWQTQGRRRRACPRVPQDNLAECLQPVDDRERRNGWRVDAADDGHHALNAPRERNEDDPVLNARDNAVRGGAPIDEEYHLQDFIDSPNVWELNPLQRRELHKYWVKEVRMNQRRKLRELTLEYEEACKNVIEVENEIELSLLRKAKVVGMTTTAAAKHHSVLKSLKSEIIVVEEAAEVLEGHILACLSSSVKHLILIGDHLQLRPSVAVYRLSTEHNLDISMFERLVKSGVEHVTLQEQRRMRPSISKLVRSLYPKSRDHNSVTHYEEIKGVKSSVFFFDHKAGEDNVRDAASKLNSTEAKLVVELCLYLLNQGYTPEDIAILSMYTGQLLEIKRLLKERSRSKWYRKPIGENSEGQEPDLPRVSSVDDYQGEESNIIILSLVRSNVIATDKGIGKIGFLRTPNRICVALTRAKKGLFVFGNAELLAERSTLWNEVTTRMRNDGELGPELEFYCQNHPDTVTRISAVEDFKQVEDGGCSLPCESQLECGHACPRRCHLGSHDVVVCSKSCLRKYENCLHICKLRCHCPGEICPPCVVIVTKEMPDCGHRQSVQCSTDVKDEHCNSPCPKDLQCGHRCRLVCGRPCTEHCREEVTKMLPCGHSARMSCHEDPATYSCGEPCEAILEDCQHECGGSCGKCKQGTAHIPCERDCGRTLPCGHVCGAGCSRICPPCRKTCRKRCFHCRCSERCGHLCKPCRESCSWQCKHFKCEKICHEICTRPRCNFPCPLKLKCGHHCIGLCGELCPQKCRVCHPETLDVITRMTLAEYEESDRFVQLVDCGHIFEVSGLDTWMDSSECSAEREDGSVAIKLKECPECRTPIWRSHRYANVVKKKHIQVEDVKKRVLGYEKVNEGNILLKRGDHFDALSAFRRALQANPGLMEAHFGSGLAFCAERQYAKAMIHLSFIVGRSSFSSSLAKLIESARGRGYGAGFFERCYASSLSRADELIAKKAIVHWAHVLSITNDFSSAIELCDALLARHPDNSLAAEVKSKAQKGEVQMIVQAMSAEVGARGHWYACPNGHYYCIGECGGASQISNCPDCHVQVGGQNHRLLPGNRHSNIDGSEKSAWPGT